MGLANIFRDEHTCPVHVQCIIGMNICVESYCATATLSSATVPSGQYANYDCSNSQAICSVDAGQPLLGSIKRRLKKARKQEKKIKVSTARMKVQRGID